MALTVMPIKRSGKDRSQTTGNRTSASNATGQQSTSKMHHARKTIITLISGTTRELEICFTRTPHFAMMTFNFVRGQN